MPSNMLSPTALSNLFTKKVATAVDARQLVPDKPGMVVPPQTTRKLCAQLIVEEALETVKALGFQVEARVSFRKHDELQMEFCGVVPTERPVDWEEAVDGACDTIYVATGLLCAMGAPDLPHLAEVCRANDRKFPGGNALIDRTTGKYLKPMGWSGPNHSEVASRYRVNMAEQAELVFKAKGIE